MGQMVTGAGADDANESVIVNAGLSPGAYAALDAWTVNVAVEAAHASCQPGATRSRRSAPATTSLDRLLISHCTHRRAATAV